MDKFLKNQNLQELLVEEIENVNKPIMEWLPWEILSDSWEINIFEILPENSI